jgi:hypothetical protein
VKDVLLPVIKGSLQTLSDTLPARSRCLSADAEILVGEVKEVLEPLRRRSSTT